MDQKSLNGIEKEKKIFSLSCEIQSSKTEHCVKRSSRCMSYLICKHLLSWPNNGQKERKNEKQTAKLLSFSFFFWNGLKWTKNRGENMVKKVAGFTQFVLSISKVLTTNYIIRIQSPNQPVSISTKKVAFL